MKKTTLIILSLISLFKVFSQDTTLVYLNENFYFTQKDSARYIREVIVKNNHYFITDKQVNGVIYNYCEFSSLVPRIEEGNAIHYNDIGEVYSKGNYKSGKIYGKWIYCNNNSVDTVEYVSGMYNEKKDYPTAKYYMDDKSNITVGKLIMDSLSIFIKNKYHQPARARYEFKRFTVRINCIVDTNGKVVLCPGIIYPSVHPDIDSEIYRILGLFHYDVVIKKPFTITIELPYDEKGFHENNIHNAIYSVVEQMPKFRSNGSIRQYIETQLKADSCNCIGRVRVNFVVEKDGTIGQVELIEGVDDCDGYFEKIEKILKSCPKWIPGKTRNIPLRVRLTTFVSLNNNH